MLFDTFSPSQLRDAIEIELQHDENPKTAAITALKRLEEDPEYYSKRYRILGKAGGPRSNHKYIRREADGKGGWIYIYKEEERQETAKDKTPQTETPEFKAWFGDSKVVDKEGKPLVVYHGTNKDFTEFNSDADGIYFTSDKSHDFIRDTKKTISVFLKIENPYYAKTRYEIESAIYKGDWNNNVSFANELTQKGHDGIIYKGGKDKNYEGNNSPQYVVFHPIQIKSATGNLGTSDPNEADMTKAGERAGHKYYKRVPKPTGKGYYYFYTQQQFKDYQNHGVLPEEKTGSFNLLTVIKNLFGLGDERQAKEKIKSDYTQNAIGDRFSITLDSWANHLNEYFKNKDKWDALFNKEKGDTKPKTGGAKIGEKKPSIPKEKSKSVFKISVMKAIHGLYGEVKPSRPVAINIDPEKSKSIKVPDEIKKLGIGSKKYQDFIKENWEKNGSKKEVQVTTEEQYLASKGFSRQDIGESALHKNRGGMSDKQWNKVVERQAEKDKEIIQKREELRKEYNDKVSSGEIRPPTREEQLTEIASGHEDNEATRAAKRLLEKRKQKKIESTETAKETPTQEKEDIKISRAIATVTPETRIGKELEVIGAEKPKEDSITSPKVDFEPAETTITIPFHKGGNPEEFKAVDYTKVAPKDIYLVSEKKIMDTVKPSYIPAIDEDFFKYSNYMITAYKIEENKYIVSTDSKRSNYGMRGFDVRGEEKYAIVNRDVLAATQDYYLKLAKVKMKAEAERLKNEGKRVKKRSIRMLPENKMSYHQVDLIKSFIGNIPSYDKSIWNNYKEMRADLKQKTEDMEIQLEEFYNSFAKGKETSYGDSGTKDNLLNDYGVKVKRQNGAEISGEEITEIKLALDDVFSAYGNKSSMAKSFGLKISHSGEKFMHARKAAGLFIPSMKAIGVTAQYGSGGTGFILSHEWGHFMDYYLGEKSGKHYSSDDPENVAGQIASRFRKNMVSPQKSIYQNRTCECFARSMEQYYAIKTNNTEIMESWNKNGNHPSNDVFKEKIYPLIEKFFIDNESLLKAINKFGKIFYIKKVK